MTGVRRTGVAFLAMVVILVASTTAGANVRHHRREPVARPAALATCGTYKLSWFDGYAGTVGQGATEGAYGEITTRAGAACGSDHSPSHNAMSVWVLVATGDNSGGYVQSGYTAGYGQCFVHFAQIRQSNSSSPQSKFGGCIATDGSNHSYNEQYGSGCGCEYAKIDGTVWMTTSWNPYSYWRYPFEPQYEGESTYRESDMPGNAGSPTSFGNLQGQNGNDNNYYGYGGACSGYFIKGNDGAATRSDGKAWYDRITSCPSFNIYTDIAGH